MADITIVVSFGNSPHGGFDMSLKPLFLRSDLIYTMYGSDEVDGSEIFKEGSRLTVEETAVLSMERLAILLSGRYVIRGESELLYAEFHGESEKMQGDQISVNGMVNLWNFLNLEAILCWNYVLSRLS